MRHAPVFVRKETASTADLCLKDTRAAGDFSAESTKLGSCL
jgi:hypothetical protein